MAVNYIVQGNISVCTYYQCPIHLECKVDYNNEPYCGCISYCGNNLTEVFCGTDFFTYPSQCHIDKLYCENNGNETKTNVTLAYPGKCESKSHNYY